MLFQVCQNLEHNFYLAFSIITMETVKLLLEPKMFCTHKVTNTQHERNLIIKVGRMMGLKRKKKRARTTQNLDLCIVSSSSKSIKIFSCDLYVTREGHQSFVFNNLSHLFVIKVH